MIKYSIEYLKNWNIVKMFTSEVKGIRRPPPKSDIVS